MPVYDYVCSSCDYRFELRKSWSEDTSANCIKCGAVAIKQFASPAIVYKGSGFYTTDTRAANNQTNVGSKVANSSSKNSSGVEKDTATATSGKANEGKSETNNQKGPAQVKSNGSTSGGDTK